jgi:dual-specificity kinase
MSQGRNKRKHDEVSHSSDDSLAAEERAEHHYMLRSGDEFDSGRYRVTKQLGKGTFGRVVEMMDTTENKAFAVKVVRAVEKYAREAEIESEIIRSVQRTLPPEERFPVVRLHRTFESRGHYCIVFEKMGPSLYGALKQKRASAEGNGGGSSRGGAGSYFSLAQISHIAADCFVAMAHMHRIHLTHTDLKPENILFVHPPDKGGVGPRPDVALIDFGGATWHHDHHSSVVCTRQYRPPEVILGLEWGTPIDLWSMGCILAELWTGSLLFSTHETVEVGAATTPPPLARKRPHAPRAQAPPLSLPPSHATMAQPASPT